LFDKTFLLLFSKNKNISIQNYFYFYFYVTSKYILKNERPCPHGHHKITGIPAIYAWNGASNGASGLGYAS
jgi:hypothetical protein